MLIFAFLGLGVHIIKSKPAQPIVVVPTHLSIYERKDMQNLAKRLGAVQFYQADLNEIKAAVLELSWVDSVRVYRDWHLGVVVDIKPKKAVANFGSEHFLDANGALFSPANKAMLGKNRLANLQGSADESILVMQKMQKLNTWFAPLDLVAVDVILTPRHTWLIRFDNGLRVIVDHDRVDEKLYTLSHMLLDKNNNLQVERIQSVDLRYKNGFSISWKD